MRTEGIDLAYLANNAGLGLFKRHRDRKLDDEQGMIDFNITTLTRLTKLFLPGMVARGSGRVLNVASTAGFQPGPYMAVHYATKACVLSYSEALAQELEGTGVTVAALCPGPPESGFATRASAKDSGLFKGARISDSATVADAGYRAMMAGKRVVVPGVRNWRLAQSARFAPLEAIAATVAKMSEPRRSARSHP